MAQVASGSLAARIRRVFLRAWRAYGRPRMAAVRPISQWRLPEGFAYDAARDAIADSAGAILANWDAYWEPVDYIYIVPADTTADLRAMAAAGVVPSGLMDVYVLAADAPTVEACHAIQIQGDWYDVLEVSHGPAGASGQGAWAQVRLQRRS